MSSLMLLGIMIFMFSCKKGSGFKTKASAEKVARLVIGKIQKGEMPPCVTIQEMEKLKVL